MKRLLIWVLLLSGCYREMTDAEWRQLCVEHPYYTYYTAYEAGKSQRDIGGPIGGHYDGNNNRCSPMSLVQLWESPDPDVQYTIAALKEMTGESTMMEVKLKLKKLEVLDFRAYPEIRDLRPLLSRSVEVNKVIHLPEGAQVNSLWALQKQLEVLDAPGVTVTGTRPEDCPTEDYLHLNAAASFVDYPRSVIEFCQQLGR